MTRSSVLVIVIEELVGHVADIVHRVKKKTAGAACGIKHVVVSRRLEHLNGELDDLTRCEVLAEVALEKPIKELLEGNALGIEISLVEVDCLQMGHAHLERTIIN